MFQWSNGSIGNRMKLGVDLGGTKIEGIAMDGSRERARVRVPTPREDYLATVAAVATLVAGLEREAGAADSIGIGIPGTISPSTGLEECELGLVDQSAASAGSGADSRP